MRDAQMRDAQLLAPQRQAAPVAEKVHTGTIVTEHPNQMWGIDATATVTIEEDQVTVFAAVDHCTAECVGIHAVKRATRFEALDPIRQGVNEHFGGFHAHGATGLQLRHDHGSQFMSDDFQNEIRSLEIEFSPAFVREPEGNGCIERFFKTLKEQLLWVRHFPFHTGTGSRPSGVRALYNRPWLIERVGFQSPVQGARTSCARTRCLIVVGLFCPTNQGRNIGWAQADWLRPHHPDAARLRLARR